MMMYFEWIQKTTGDDHKGTSKKAEVKSQKYIRTFGPQVKSKIHRYFWTTSESKTT